MTRNAPAASPGELCPRFGKIAVDLGFVTEEQVRQALEEQLSDNFAGRPHRVLGAIFFEHGWMSPGQIETVLERMFRLLQETGGSLPPSS